MWSNCLSPVLRMSLPCIDIRLKYLVWLVNAALGGRAAQAGWPEMLGHAPSHWRYCAARLKALWLLLLQADKRAHHNALERKRRDHIKDSFHSLRDSVPALQGEKVSMAPSTRPERFWFYSPDERRAGPDWWSEYSGRHQEVIMRKFRPLFLFWHQWD